MAALFRKSPLYLPTLSIQHLTSPLTVAILAAKFHTLSHVSFIVCFAFLQFFFNFGANTTTYCYPAEVFPTRFRASAHGLSAAAGKAGAIISALVFNQLSKEIGTPAVLWIFFGICILGACTFEISFLRAVWSDLLIAPFFFSLYAFAP